MQMSVQSIVRLSLACVLVAVIFWALTIGLEGCARRAVPTDLVRGEPLEPSDRFQAALRIVEKGHLLGQSETDVTKALGRPDERLDRDVYKLVGRSSLIVNYSSEEFVKKVAGSAFPQDLIQEEFDLELWRTGSADERQRMAKSICTNVSGELFGRSRRDVRSILGEPTRRHTILTYDLGSGNVLVSPFEQTLYGITDTRTDRLMVTLYNGVVTRVIVPHISN